MVGELRLKFTVVSVYLSLSMLIRPFRFLKSDACGLIGKNVTILGGVSLANPRSVVLYQ